MTTKTTKTEAKTEAKTLETLTGVFACQLSVTEKAKVVTQRQTLQAGGVPTKLGRGWHKGCKPATNSRHTALAALAKLPQPFSLEQGMQALAALPKSALGSGSPRSYLSAFVQQGYLSAVAA